MPVFELPILSEKVATAERWYPYVVLLFLNMVDVGHGEIADYQHFFRFSHFQRAPCTGLFKIDMCDEGFSLVICFNCVI